MSANTARRETGRPAEMAQTARKGTRWLQPFVAGRGQRLLRAEVGNAGRRRHCDGQPAAGLRRSGRARGGRSRRPAEGVRSRSCWRGRPGGRRCEGARLPGRGKEPSPPPGRRPADGHRANRTSSQLRDGPAGLPRHCRYFNAWRDGASATQRHRRLQSLHLIIPQSDIFGQPPPASRVPLGLRLPSWTYTLGPPNQP
jgi:hypothetical protein